MEVKLNKISDIDKRIIQRTSGMRLFDKRHEKKSLYNLYDAYVSPISYDRFSLITSGKSPVVSDEEKELLSISNAYISMLSGNETENDFLSSFSVYPINSFLIFFDEFTWLPSLLINEAIKKMGGRLPNGGRERLFALCLLNASLVRHGINSILFNKSFFLRFSLYQSEIKALLMMVLLTPLFPKKERVYGRIPSEEKILSFLSYWKRKSGIQDRVFLFGSFARGTQSKKSDIDFAILFVDDTSSFQKNLVLADEKRELESVFLRPSDGREIIDCDEKQLNERLGRYKEAK